MSDSTRIALDIYPPAVSRTPATEPLPVALMVTRYRRSSEMEDGSIRTLPGTIPAGNTGAGLLDPKEYRSEGAGPSSPVSPAGNGVRSMTCRRPRRSQPTSISPPALQQRDPA